MPKPKTLREKVRQRKLHRRLVLGPWFKPVMRERFLRPVPIGKVETRRIQKVREAHPNWTDGSIVRLGNIARKSTRKEKTVALPAFETTYFTRLSHVAGKKHITRALKQLPDRFEKAPYSLGANAIVELVNKKGKPTHIIMIKRPRNVEAPGTFDFLAGLVRKGKTPVKLLKERIKKEVGIPKKMVKTIGRGFRESKRGEALALNLSEKLLNYDTVYVMRASLSPEELQERFRKTKGEWKPPEIAIIERSPEAIREFIRKNINKVLMPEALRLYARELALHPGKGAKKAKPSKEFLQWLASRKQK